MSNVLFKNNKQQCISTFNSIISEMQDLELLLKSGIYKRLIDRNIKLVNKAIDKISNSSKYDEDEIGEVAAEKFVGILTRFYRDVELTLRRTKDKDIEMLQLFNDNLSIETLNPDIYNTEMITVPTDNKSLHGVFKFVDIYPHKFWFINEDGEEDFYITKGQADIYSANYEK